MESDDDNLDGGTNKDDDSIDENSDNDGYDDDDSSAIGENDYESITQILHIIDAIFNGLDEEQILDVLSDDTREDWEDLNQLRVLLSHVKRLRRKQLRHRWKSLKYLRRMLLHTNQFTGAFWMEPAHFDYLLEQIHDDLSVDELQSSRSTSDN